MTAKTVARLLPAQWKVGESVRIRAVPPVLIILHEKMLFFESFSLAVSMDLLIRRSEEFKLSKILFKMFYNSNLNPIHYFKEVISGLSNGYLNLDP